MDKCGLMLKFYVDCIRKFEKFQPFDQHQKSEFCDHYKKEWSHCISEMHKR